MDDDSAARNVVLAVVAGLLAAMGIVALVGMTSCATVASHADSIERLAQCVEPIVQDEIKRREAEQAANAEQAQKQVDSAKRDAGAM